MSPRRSSRARQHQPLVAPLQPSNSNSSSSTGHPERNARSIQQHGSLKRSPSSDPSAGNNPTRMEAIEQQARQTRQKRRGLEAQDDVDIVTPLEDVVDDDLEEEEEVTRCVCRRQEYPGLPVPLEESTNSNINSRGHKGKDHNSSSTITISDGLPEDAGSLFIQCDDCKVWQHGGCVGIMDESMSPENYYCEECRKDLHKLMVGARGQRYSRYLPVFEAANPPPKSSRKSPVSKDSESRSSGDPEAKGNAAAASLSSAKRRSTMNSRAAMDEEEALRKAIEESRTDGSSAGTVNGSRKGKRGRDDSEEAKHDLKRRKTGSEVDSADDLDLALLAAESDEESGMLKSRTSNAARKAKGAATTVQREKEVREREKERERERAEAAGRRKGRAEKRHADESEPGEETLRPGPIPRMTAVARPAKSNALNRVQSAAAASQPLNTPASHKKQTKTTVRRTRMGRNQHTRDTTMDSKTDSPRPSHSRDGEDGSGGSNETITGPLLSNGNRPSKPRLMNSSKFTMSDVRRRAAGILEYISRTQVEMAGEKIGPTEITPSIIPVAPITARPPLGRNMSVNGLSKLSRQMDGQSGDDAVAMDTDRAKADDKSFRQMSTLQMMDVLTSELVHWQKDFGKWPDK